MKKLFLLMLMVLSVGCLDGTRNERKAMINKRPLSRHKTKRGSNGPVNGSNSPSQQRKRAQKLKKQIVAKTIAPDLSFEKAINELSDNPFYGLKINFPRAYALFFGNH